MFFFLNMQFRNCKFLFIQHERLLKVHKISSRQLHEVPFKTKLLLWLVAPLPIKLMKCYQRILAFLVRCTTSLKNFEDKPCTPTSTPRGIGWLSLLCIFNFKSEPSPNYELRSGNTIHAIMYSQYYATKKKAPMFPPMMVQNDSISEAVRHTSYGTDTTLAAEPGHQDAQKRAGEDLRWGVP